MSFTTHLKNGIEFDSADHIATLHAFTTRYGGVSEPPFDSLNFADNRGDKAENLLENYRRLGAAVGFDDKRVVCCRQVHSATVIEASEEHAGKVLWNDRPFDADALVTNIPELPLVVFSSDCCTALFFDPVTRSIGAAHAGWRGTADSIVFNVVREMERRYGAKAENIRVALGPSIHPCCFETHRDVPDALHEMLGADAEQCIETMGEKFRVDLNLANRLWLKRAGILEENIDTHPDCTGCDLKRYWSHRKMGEKRGGQIALIVLNKEAAE